MATSTNKVILGICGYEQVPFTFINQLSKIMSLGVVDVATASGLYIQVNRSLVVNKVLEVKGWDYLLFIDTDMLFPDNLMERVKHYKDPVVGGMYWRRKYPDYSPIPGNMNDGDRPQFNQLSPQQLVPMLKKPGLYPVDVLGTGCLAIRRDVLENWPEEQLPMFTTMQSNDGAEIVTEDVYFCWRLKQQGIQPMLDTSVCCGHIGPINIGKTTYLESLKTAKIVK